MLTLVLENFWTYCCVSWMYARTHVTVLHAKYRDRGLAGGGIHRPAFPFERSTLGKGRGIDRPAARLLNATS